MSEIATKQPKEVNLKSLTKKIIFDSLMKIKIDHSIQISQGDLEAKVFIIYEDCKDMEIERFLTNVEMLRKQELFGKFPPAFKFLNPANSDKAIKITDSFALAANKIAGSDLIIKKEINGWNEMVIVCRDKGALEEMKSLTQEQKTEIKKLIDGLNVVKYTVEAANG